MTGYMCAPGNRKQQDGHLSAIKKSSQYEQEMLGYTHFHWCKAYWDITQFEFSQLIKKHTETAEIMMLQNDEMDQFLRTRFGRSPLH